MNSGSKARLERPLWSRQARFERRLKFQRLLKVAAAVVRGQVSYYPPFVEAFEQSFADFVGCRHGISFCNGTSSLEAALFAVGVEVGDEVIVPAHTFHASITPILNAGARPVFVDIDLASQTLDPAEIARRASPRTRCVIVVHLFGNPAHMEQIAAACRDYSLSLIEDASHAHGALFHGRPVGSFGDVGCFSLQGDKSVAAGEGGIAVTNRSDLFQRLSLFGHFGRHASQADSKWSELGETGVGHKRRANPLGICMAQVDLDHLEERNAAKRRLAFELNEALRAVPGLCPVEGYSEAQPGGFYPGLPARIDPALATTRSVSDLVAALRREGIQAAAFPYGKYHRMPHMVDPNYRRKLLHDPNLQDSDSKITLPELPATDTAQVGTFLLPLPEFPDSRYVATARSALLRFLDS